MTTAYGKTWASWRAMLVARLDRERARAYPTHCTPCGSSTITGRTFHS